jgi:2-hydroxycyclohexanecarboxyl-CoA dehydrogenase
MPTSDDDIGELSMWRAAENRGFMTDEMKARIAKVYPLRRLATPDDIVGAVLFFASDGAGFITGQTLSVSGGYTMI